MVVVIDILSVTQICTLRGGNLSEISVIALDTKAYKTLLVLLSADPDVGLSMPEFEKKIFSLRVGIDDPVGYFNRLECLGLASSSCRNDMRKSRLKATKLAQMAKIERF